MISPRKITIVLSIFVTLFIFYSPLFECDFGVADDFDTLWKYKILNSHDGMFLKNLRLLAEPLGKLFYDLIGGDFYSFWVLRMIYAALLSCAVVVITFILVRLGLPWLHSLFLAVIIGLSPAAQASSPYGLMCFAPLSIIFSAWSAYFMWKSTEKLLGRKFKLAVMWACLSMLSIIMSFNIYTVYAQMYFSFLLCILLTRFTSRKFQYYYFYFCLLYFLASAIQYVISAKIAPLIHGYELSERVHVDYHNIPAAIVNFFFRPLKDVLNLYNLSYWGPLSNKKTFSGILIESCVFIFIFRGIFMYLSSTINWWRLIIIVTLVPASYSMHLLLGLDFTPYRTQMGLFSTVLIMLYFSIIGYKKYFSLSSKVISCALFMLLVLFFITGYHNIRYLIVSPHRQEWLLVKQAVYGAIKEKKQEMTVFYPTAAMQHKRVTYYDDYGMLASMYSPGKFLKMIYICMAQNGVVDPPGYTVNFIQDEHVQEITEASLLNLRVLY